MFWKKKKMIDVRELHKTGFKIPRNSETITDKEGFVEINKIHSNPESSSVSSFQGDIYSKHDIDARLERLDNLIYKLEQRVELLERKLGVGDSTPAINW